MHNRRKPSMSRIAGLVCFALFGVAAILASMPQAFAEDELKVAVVQGARWETAAAELGQNAGIFKKFGIVLDFEYVADAEEVRQSVISGAAVIGLGVSAMAAMQAYERGAPIRIIGANLAGSVNYWYVLKSSPVRSYKDIAGKTLAYERNGSSSHFDAIDFTKQFRLKAKLAPTGGEALTLQQLKSGEIDVGWAAPPFGLEEIGQDAIRVVARANDVPNIRKKTVSVMIANAGFLQKHKDVVGQFVWAYRKSVDWMYSDPAAVQRYAELAGVSSDVASRLRDQFFTKEMLLPETIVGLNAIIKDADALAYLRKALSRKQLRDLIQIPTGSDARSSCSGGAGIRCWLGIAP